MGAENSVLEGCEWGEEVESSGLDWDLQHAVTKDDRLVTVFQPKKNERKYNDMLHQLAGNLKTIRHPNIVRYVDEGKSSDGHFLVTEQVTPLTAVFDQLSPLEISAGLADILDALIFLHDKVGVTHNNLGASSVFVAKDGGWRLGELQHACPFSSATSSFLDACRSYRDQAALSPEEKQGQVEVKAGQGHARDVYAMGVFTEQLNEQLSELGSLSKTFEHKQGRCLSTDPALRPQILELKNDSLFQNDFIHILKFVRNIAAKSAEEKLEFFSGLLPRLLALPEELVARRLAVPLLSRFVLLDGTAVSHVVPHLLTPKPDPDASPPPQRQISGISPIMSAELFKECIIPELKNILLVHDAHIRLVLMAHFSCYCSLFDKDVLHADIFPQVLLGLRDTSDEIVASSLRALADLVPLLGGDIVMGAHRKTFFFQGMPKFSGREKDAPPKSVSDAMTAAKSPITHLAANGKALLIDLASSGIQATSEMDKERKRLERERRREEARQRKDERQRKLKLRQLEDQEEEKLKSAQSKAASRPTDTEGTAKLGDDSESDTDTEKTTDDHSRSTDHEDSYHKHNSAKQVTHNQEAEGEEEEKREGEEEENKEEEEKFADSDSEEEWEDWENSADTSPSKSHDDIISDEIEAELVKMSTGKSTRESVLKKEKVATSPDPYQYELPSPAEAEWSHDGFDVHSPKKAKSTVINNETSPQKDLPAKSSSHTSSSKPQAVTGKGLKLVTKHKSGAQAAAKSATQARKGVDDLGAGYDVKSIELTVVKDEVDFFADMAPEIKPSASDKSLGLSEHGGNSSGMSEMSVSVSSSSVSVGKDMTAETKSESDLAKGKTEAAGSSSSTLFAVVDATAEVESGWDADDWGADDF